MTIPEMTNAQLRAWIAELERRIAELERITERSRDM